MADQTKPAQAKPVQVPTKPRCSNCNKGLEAYEVIRYTDSKGWCSLSCKVKWEKKPASSVR
jgi:hypothetical protein